MSFLSRSTAILAVLLSAFTLGASSCSNGEPAGNGPDEPGVESRLDRLKRLQVPDAGHAALVQRFFAACAANDAASAQGCLTPWATAEAQNQFTSISPSGDPKDTFRAYVAASQRNLAALESHGPDPEFPHPWRPGGESGVFVTYHLKRRDSRIPVVLGIYMQVTDGRLLIDNVVTDARLVIGEAAPALGPGVGTPADAFNIYHYGVLLGMHPLHLSRTGESRLDMAHRLTYLRSCASPAFIAAILREDSDITRFIRTGEEQLTKHFEVSDPESKGEPNAVYVVLIPRQPGGSHIIQRLDCVRMHGQFRLDRQVEVPALPESK